MSVKTSKKELQELAERLGAVRLERNGVECRNIFDYENAVYNLEQEARKQGKCGYTKQILRSENAYSTTGRLDWCEPIQQFVCWY